MAKELRVEKYRKKLLEERERRVTELRARTARSWSEDQSETLGELSDYDNHPADTATETFERGRALALEENLEDMIERIDQAIRKIDEGTYGLCDRCGREISSARLDILPYATLCVDCQDITEGR